MENTRDIVPVSVVIPTFKRISHLELTLEKIGRCNPQPSEIIVFVDYGDEASPEFLRKNFPDIVVLVGKVRSGPGGGRNECIRRAANKYIAGFDDDSYPTHEDYFKVLHDTFLLFPDAVVIESSIFHINEQPTERVKGVYYERYNFTGCGCAYNRELFLRLGGYVPKPVAYGIEEVDLSMKALEAGLKIIHFPFLQVCHNTRLSHHTSPGINAAAITNLALLIYLRYPISMYYYGVPQVLNRVVWAIKSKRFRGVVTGILNIPSTCLAFSKYRHRLAKKTIKKYRKVRAESNIITISNGQTVF